MKPIKIFDILDLAFEARKQGQVFNPLFTGEAGLGKSAIVQQWVAKKRLTNPNFFFKDLRIAYMEAPDMIGFPDVEEKNGVKRTVHSIPEFWPDAELTPDLKGLILLEEPNRGTTGVMNCLMQVLTDRKIHKLKIPDGVIIAGCINPDSAEYDVNHMDAALKNRFEEFAVEYDHLSFSSYIEENKWHEDIIMFVNQGIWIYKPTSELAENATYISPRTWEKVNAALQAGIKKDRIMHRLVMCSILGRDIGNEFHKASFEEAPVTAKDILTDKSSALKRLKKQSHKDHYRGDMIAATVESICRNYGGLKEDCKEDQIDEATMVEVAKIIPADQTLVMIKQCGFKQSKGQMLSFFKDFVKKYPDLLEVVRDAIKLSRVTDK